MPPTTHDLAVWLKMTATAETDRHEVLSLALDAAVEEVTEDCEVPDPWPSRVRLACLMIAARRLKRADSPEGVAGFGEFGAVRVSRVDPDIRALLAPYYTIGIA